MKAREKTLRTKLIGAALCNEKNLRLLYKYLRWQYKKHLEHLSQEPKRSLGLKQPEKLSSETGMASGRYRTLGSEPSMAVAAFCYDF